MRSSSSRMALTAVMDLLVVWAVVLTAGIVLRFFGALADAPAIQDFLRVVGRIALPLGLPDVPTPYGGRFAADVAASIAALLAVEWGLSLLRRRLV